MSAACSGFGMSEAHGETVDYSSLWGGSVEVLLFTGCNGFYFAAINRFVDNTQIRRYTALYNMFSMVASLCVLLACITPLFAQHGSDHLHRNGHNQIHRHANDFLKRQANSTNATTSTTIAGTGGGVTITTPPTSLLTSAAIPEATSSVSSASAAAAALIGGTGSAAAAAAAVQGALTGTCAGPNQVNVAPSHTFPSSRRCHRTVGSHACRSFERRFRRYLCGGLGRSGNRYCGCCR